MSELKTKPTNASVEEYLNTVEPEEKRRDSLALLSLFRKITGEKGQMWDEAIIGFGMYHYKSQRSSQEGDWPLVAFSPRKQSLTLYLMQGFKDDQGLLQKLGKHKTSVGCLYINKLSDIDIAVLSQLIEQSYLKMKTLHT